MSGGFRVDGPTSPVLTIEAGVIIRFASQSYIGLGGNAPGTIRVMGTAVKPVKMIADTPSPAKGFYKGLLFANLGSGSELHYLEMSHCGAGSPGACIFATGNFDGTPSILVDHVAIDNSSQDGVTMWSQAQFAAGSQVLTVTNSGEYPVSIEENYAGTLPVGGTFTGNALNSIDIAGTGGVTRTQTWPNLGIPYDMNTYYDLYIGGPAAPVLTLAPGTELRFILDGGIKVGYGAPGALIADGTCSGCTAPKPVTFTAQTSTPSAGYWGGIWFGQYALLTSKINFAILEYGGAGFGFSPADPALILVTREIGGVISNTIFRNSAGCGLTRGGFQGQAGVPTTDFTAPALANTFTSIAFANQCGPYT